MDRDGYRDELAVAHERIARLEEQVHELLRARDAPELPSPLMTLRRERVAAVAQHAVINSGVPSFAMLAIVAALVGLLSLFIGWVGIAVTLLFAFLSVRAFGTRQRELRAQRTQLEQLDQRIAEAEHAELSSVPVRVRLAERTEGEDEEAYAERLRLLR